MTNTLTFAIAPTNTLSSVNWNFGGATTPNTASGNSAAVTLITPMPTNSTIPVTINSSRTNTDSGGGLCTTKQTVVNLIPDNITRDGKLIYSTNDTVCVGQQINLTNLVSGIPASAITGYHWNIPGNTFKNYATNSAGQFTGVLTTLQTNDLVKPGISFYWIDGATNRVVSCTATIYGHTNTATASLNIEAPTVSIDTSDTDGVAAVDQNYMGPSGPTEANNIAVHFGDGALTGVKFVANVTPPPDFSTAHYTWIQLTTLSMSASSGGTNYSFGPVINALDSSAPYGPPDILFADSPGQNNIPQGESYSFDTDNFVTYLLWLPNLPNAQYVPVKSVAWGWTGKATYVSGTNWTGSNLTGPGSLTVSTATNHPTWTAKWSDTHWVPGNPP